MEFYWRMVSSIMGGVRTMRAGGEAYLPKFEAEGREAYNKRLSTARMTNIFADVIYNLAVRPFEQPVQLGENTTQQLKDFAEDVDGTGDDLTMFAARVFRHALEDGITWVLSDHTKSVDLGRPLTVAEEREMGSRPLWAEYRAADMLAVYSERVNGEERFTEARLRETSVDRDGFEEKTIERVRVLRHAEGSAPTWELWRKKESAAAPAGQNVVGEEWELEEGPHDYDGIDVIPLVPIVFGHRQGNGWLVDPPLRDAAYLQLELYQQENGLKNVRNFTAYPMLAGNGIEPEQGEDGNPKELVVGPRSVLFTGSGEGTRSWAYVEPAGASLRFLRDDIKDTIRDLRELGRQPLSLETGNITVIATAALTQKNNSAVQAWAGFLGHGLERALELTADWLNIEDPEITVTVHSDFDLGVGGDVSFAHVLQMGTGAEPIISREAVLEEAVRRGILSSHYDAEADLELIDRGVDDPPPNHLPAA